MVVRQDRQPAPYRKMIVGLFSELLSPGGVQTAGRQTAAALALAADGRGVPCRFLSLNDPSGLHSISLRGTQVTFQGHGGNRTQFVIAALRASLSEAKFVWAAHPHLSPVALAMKLRRPNLKIILGAHGVEVWTPLPPVRHFAMMRADLVIAPSRYTAQQLVACQGIPSSRVHVLPWALDPAFEAAAASPQPRFLPAGLPPGPMILTVGRWSADERYKGLDQLMDVMPAVRSVVPDAFLAAVGNGNDRARLEHRAAALHLKGAVRFFDAVQGDELVAFYNRCDVFALPSSGEGFGLVFLEAMALARPVVGGVHGGIPDIVSDGVTGFLVSQDDLAGLSSSLIKLLQDPDLRHAMGSAGLVRLRRDFLFETFAEHVREILRLSGFPS